MNIPTIASLSSSLSSWYSSKGMYWAFKHPMLLKTYAFCMQTVGYVCSPFVALSSLLSKKNKPFPSSLDSVTKSQIKAKYDLYMKLTVSTQDSHGFIYSDQTDSLLYSSLYASSGPKVDIAAARDQSGAWYRRPVDNPCWTEQSFLAGNSPSASTISRDMLTGLLWYFWANNCSSLSKQTYDYGSKDHFIMGQGDPTRVYMGLGLEATLAEVVKRTQGDDHLSRWFLQSWPSGLTDYQAHLAVLHILLRGNVLGYITTNMLNLLKEQVARQPQNPLFQYALHKYTDGDQSLAGKILLDTTLWPSDRLPTTSDRAGRWLMTNDYGPNWQPGTGNQVLSGGDFLFMANLLLKD